MKVDEFEELVAEICRRRPRREEHHFYEDWLEALEGRGLNRAERLRLLRRVAWWHRHHRED